MIEKSMDGKIRVLSLSYGKDSMACLGAIEQLGWTLDRIVTADVWATDTIPADLPPMVEFKDYADRVIKERYGIEVEHYTAKKVDRVCSEKVSYDSYFYQIMQSGKHIGTYKGFPMQRGNWCTKLKLSALSEMPKCDIQYLGIAADEPKRFHDLTDKKLSPLIEIGWSEADCRLWCEENGLLSPIYTQSARGGCWFCQCQGVQPLRLLRKQYPDLWALLLKWDADSPVTFRADGHTVHDFDRRFAAEDLGLVPTDRKFRWSMV